MVKYVVVHPAMDQMIFFYYVQIHKTIQFKMASFLFHLTVYSL